MPNLKISQSPKSNYQNSNHTFNFESEKQFVSEEHTDNSGNLDISLLDNNGARRSQFKNQQSITKFIPNGNNFPRTSINMELDAVNRLEHSDFCAIWIFYFKSLFFFFFHLVRTLVCFYVVPCYIIILVYAAITLRNLIGVTILVILLVICLLFFDRI